MYAVTVFVIPVEVYNALNHLVENGCCIAAAKLARELKGYNGLKEAKELVDAIRDGTVIAQDGIVVVVAVGDPGRLTFMLRRDNG